MIWPGFCVVYLSCLMLSVLLGSVVWCLSLILEKCHHYVHLLLRFQLDICESVSCVRMLYVVSNFLDVLSTTLTTPNPTFSLCFSLGDFCWPIFRFIDLYFLFLCQNYPSDLMLSILSVTVFNILIIVILSSLLDNSSTCFVSESCFDDCSVSFESVCVFPCLLYAV